MAWGRVVARWRACKELLRKRTIALAPGVMHGGINETMEHWSCYGVFCWGEVKAAVTLPSYLTTDGKPKMQKEQDNIEPSHFGLLSPFFLKSFLVWSFGPWSVPLVRPPALSALVRMVCTKVTIISRQQGYYCYMVDCIRDTQLCRSVP